MRITLAAAAFTIAAFLPMTSHAEPSEAGTSSTSDAGAPTEALGGASSGAGSAGKGGTGGSAGAAAPAPGPAPNLPDPGTDATNSCSFAGPHGHLGSFGSSLLLGAVVLSFRRRRAR